MVIGAVVLFVAALVLVILGISFIFDIQKGVGPAFEAATVDSREPSDPRRPRRTYTFLRIEGKGVAIFVTVLTFLLAAGATGGGIALLVIQA